MNDINTNGLSVADIRGLMENANVLFSAGENSAKNADDMREKIAQLFGKTDWKHLLNSLGTAPSGISNTRHGNVFWGCRYVHGNQSDPSNHFREVFYGPSEEAVYEKMAVGFCHDWFMSTLENLVLASDSDIEEELGILNLQEERQRELAQQIKELPDDQRCNLAALFTAKEIVQAYHVAFEDEEDIFIEAASTNEGEVQIKDNIIDGWYIDSAGEDHICPIVIPKEVAQEGWGEVEEFVYRELEALAPTGATVGFTQTW